jgi:hypothetical protein
VDQERKELHRSLINHREAIHGQMVFIDGPWIASSGLRSSANTFKKEKKSLRNVEIHFLTAPDSFNYASDSSLFK